MSKTETRKRNNRVQVRLDNKEHQAFLKAVKRSRLSQEVYLRHLINGVVPQDAPPPDYYSMMQQLYHIGTRSPRKHTHSMSSMYSGMMLPSISLRKP